MRTSPRGDQEPPECLTCPGSQINTSSGVRSDNGMGLVINNSLNIGIAATSPVSIMRSGCLQSTMLTFRWKHNLLKVNAIYLLPLSSALVPVCPVYTCTLCQTTNVSWLWTQTIIFTSRSDMFFWITRTSAAYLQPLMLVTIPIYLLKWEIILTSKQICYGQNFD